MTEAAAELIAPVKDFLAMGNEERIRTLDHFCGEMTARIGAL